MLTQFSVKNYKSIRDLATLDMESTAISEHQDHLIKITDNEAYLPVAVIYGPNGGGKSNILKAIGALKHKVLSPIYSVDADESAKSNLSVTDIQPYAFFDENKKMPTEFEIYFIAGGYEYSYALAICNGAVCTESLYRRRLIGKRSVKLFERNGKDIILKSDLQKLKICDGLSVKLPLLSYLGITYRTNGTVDKIISWFEQKIDFLNYGNPIFDMVTPISHSQQIKDLMLQMIRELDLDIDDFRIEKTGNRKIDIYTKHVVRDYSTELNLLEESSGTQKLFALLPFIARSLVAGGVLVIDELDAKLHPLLLQFIVNQYTDPGINRKCAQLIFTSHDISTMTSENFRRDEIWFVAKGVEQNTVLYSLIEFKSDGTSVRKDAKYNKQYLEGKYGADPYLQRIINWDTVHDEHDEDTYHGN